MDFFVLTNFRRLGRVCNVDRLYTHGLVLPLSEPTSEPHSCHYLCFKLSITRLTSTGKVSAADIGVILLVQFLSTTVMPMKILNQQSCWNRNQTRQSLFHSESLHGLNIISRASRRSPLRVADVIIPHYLVISCHHELGGIRQFPLP